MNQPPIAIAVTMGKDMVQSCGGPIKFFRLFLEEMEQEGGLWLHKCKNRPQHDILYVYVIVNGLVRYRLYYAGYETGHMIGHDGNGPKEIDWPRIILAGPMERTPCKIPMRGFQGFRYIYEPLF